MAKLTLENIPDELMEQIEQLARQQNQSVNEQAIATPLIGNSVDNTVLRVHTSTRHYDGLQSNTCDERARFYPLE